MVRNGEMTMGDVKRVLRKYWWIPVVTTVLFSLAGFVASLVLPKKYTSSTLVLVERPTVSEDLVKSVVNDDLNHRMASMKEQVLSNSRLQPMVEKYNLFPSERGKTHIEDLVERLRKTVDVELMQPMAGSGGNRQPPGFHVSVTLDNPQTAQQICSDLTSMFMKQNAEDRFEHGNETTKFLTQRLEEAKSKLDEQDAKLAEFKRMHLGSLPEEEQTNLNLLTGMNTSLEAATQALNRAQQDKAFNETLLSQQEANFKKMVEGNSNPESQEQELTNLQDQLAVLLSRYTAEHPDVIKLKAQIEDVKKRLAADPPAKSTASSSQISLREPAQLQQLRAKIKQDELNIADLSKRQTQIQESLHNLQARVQASPMVEQQFKEITRNYQTAQELYNDLLKKQDTASMGTELEHQQQSETFKVLDAPNLPSKPSSPKSGQLVGGGFGAGFVLALAILYLLAMMDKAMYTERDVELYLKLPVLTMVPSFDARLSGINQGRKLA